MQILKSTLILAAIAGAFGAGYAARTTKSTTVAAAAPPRREVLYYVDPMHPAYTSDSPGIAPDCGMALEPVYKDGGGDGGSDAARPSGSGASRPDSAIRIAPERQQLIGVTFATAEWDESARGLRTVGKVTYDETRVAHVHPRIEGWIEKVFVDFTGDLVKKGQPMLTVYSPEMLASQQELLLAVRARDLLAANPLASASRHGESLLDAARRRLLLWDLSPEQIQQVLDTGEPVHSVTLHAPASGFVLERAAFPNQKVTPDSDLYTIADLSRIWIMADVFESDIAGVHVGTQAYLSFPYPGATPVGARVTYIQPQVDPTTRTVKVRLEAPNASIALKPEMFVNVEFGLAAAKRLTVPADAVLDSGERQTVFVDLGEGYLEPRPVVAGERTGNRIAIVSGLRPGERVVASGTFLVDSESQLRAAARTMGGPTEAHHD
ncbi:MAG TPA: efflux RND transporter periplasmic adaptor subunit [Vicinamibacterales bacterium]|nr:efflux RND transporter periplasmic adaptor subunit [Vicinamibacterales bacterium]